MTATPTQREVDSVAHFIQAARELKASPIFTEEQSEISVAYDGRGVTYRVPNPRVRDAMVIPFRRIWMPGEPTYFKRICNILKRYAPQWHPYIDFFKDSCRHARQKFRSSWRRQPRDQPGRCYQLVALLPANARRCDRHQGGILREDYERELTRLGAAKFEYLFLAACHNIGLWYINVLQVAEGVLSNELASEGLKPSFVSRQRSSCSWRSCLE